MPTEAWQKRLQKCGKKSPSSPRATRRAVHKRFPAQSFNLTENKKKEEKEEDRNQSWQDGVPQSAVIKSGDPQWRS